MHPQKKQQSFAVLGIKNTPARRAVFDFLLLQKKPVDVLEITDALHKKNLDTNLVTVYRILDAFLEKGMIDRLEFQEGKYRYEIAGREHHHLICQECGTIEDISDCNIGELEKDILKKKKFLVMQHKLEFFGVCKQCQR